MKLLEGWKKSQRLGNLGSPGKTTSKPSLTTWVQSLRSTVTLWAPQAHCGTCVPNLPYTHTYKNFTFKIARLCSDSSLFNSKRFNVYLEKGELTVKSYMGKGKCSFRWLNTYYWHSIFKCLILYLSFNEWVQIVNNMSKGI